MFRTVATRSLRVPVTPTITKSTQSIARSQFTPTIRFSSTTPSNKAPRHGVKSFTARFVVVTGALLFLYNSELWDQTGRQVIPIPPTQEPVTLPTEEDISSRLAFLDQVKSAEKAEQEARAAQLSKPSDGVVAGNQSGGAEELEQEAANQGAFNEETGEINWDCPCLGGMAHGPCGEEFRSAFSCFVFSKEDPKGIDCIEKFKGMQDCFRLHPEIYGSELSSDEDDEESEARRAEVIAQAEASDGQQPTTVQGTLEDSSRDRKPTEHEVAVDDPRLGAQLGTKEEEDRKIAEAKRKEEERKEIEKKVEEFEDKVIEEEVKTVPTAIGTPGVEVTLEKPVVSEK